jgi:hypothetical protein
MTYVEIYNETVLDLLLSDTPPKPLTNPAAFTNNSGNSGITICERPERVVLKGAVEIELHSEAEALDGFFRGEALRVTREHALNSDSSRSHAICTIRVDVKNDPLDPQVHPSLFSFSSTASLMSTALQY